LIRVTFDTCIIFDAIKLDSFFSRISRFSSCLILFCCSIATKLPEISSKNTFFLLQNCLFCPKILHKTGRFFYCNFHKLFAGHGFPVALRPILLYNFSIA